MKQLYFLFLLISFQSYSQDFTKQITYSINKEDRNYKETRFEVILKKNGGYTPGSVKNIPSAVLNNFVNSYDNALNISCFVDETVSTFYFNSNNETIIIKYKNDGSQLFKRRTYAADKLDQIIVDWLAEEVTSTYKVRYITETESATIHNYEITLADDKLWVSVRIEKDQTGRLQEISRKVFSN